MRFGLMKKAGNYCVVNVMVPRIPWTTTSKNSNWKLPHLASMCCLRQRTEVGHRTGDPSQMGVVWALLQPGTMLDPSHMTLSHHHHRPVCDIAGVILES